jgi:hypothetical protein
MSNQASTNANMMVIADVFMHTRPDHYVNVTQLCKLSAKEPGGKATKAYGDWKVNGSSIAFMNSFVNGMYMDVFDDENEGFLLKLADALIENEGEEQHFTSTGFPAGSRPPSNVLGNTAQSAKSTASENDDDYTEVSIQDHVTSTELVYRGRSFPADFVKMKIREIAIEVGTGASKPTYAHPFIAINIAQWASPSFAFQVSKWIYKLLRDKHVALKEREILSIREEYDYQVGELREKLDETNGKLIKMGENLSEAHLDVTKSNTTMARVLDRVVPIVSYKYEEVIGLVRKSSSHYELYHRQNTSSEAAKVAGTFIQEFEVPSGLKTIRRIRMLSQGRKVRGVPVIPPDSFFMVSKQVHFGLGFTETQLLNDVARVVNQVKAEFMNAGVAAAAALLAVEKEEDDEEP